MFGFGKKRKLPIELEVQHWIERRMAWLVHSFGHEKLLSTPVILPSQQFFPDPFRGRAEDVPVMFDRVCDFMEVDRDSVEMHLYQDKRTPLELGIQRSAAGLYQAVDGKFQIWLEAANIADPLALVATMAHELGHVHLLGHGRINRDEPDHEPLTDLLTVLFGMGIFTANSVVRERNQHRGGSYHWSVGKQGYMTMPMFGYALAIFAAARDDFSPVWRSSMRPDVRGAFGHGIDYLTSAEGETVLQQIVAGETPSTSQTEEAREAEEEESSDSLGEQRRRREIWGINPLENKAAQNLCARLDGTSDLSVIESAIVDGFGAGNGGDDDSIDAESSCEALAACEALARLRGNWGIRDDHSQIVDHWVQTHEDLEPSDELLDAAADCIDATLGENSELALLWEGNDAWRAAVLDLKSSLER